MLILCVLKISCGIYVLVCVLASVLYWVVDTINSYLPQVKKSVAVHYSCAPADGCCDIQNMLS
jgi:hypothetical protein